MFSVSVEPHGLVERRHLDQPLKQAGQRRARGHATVGEEAMGIEAVRDTLHSARRPRRGSWMTTSNSFSSGWSSRNGVRSGQKSTTRTPLLGGSEGDCSRCLSTVRQAISRAKTDARCLRLAHTGFLVL